MICTENYHRRISGEETEEDVGLGVKWEGHLIYQHIYNAGALNSKFIPAIFRKQDKRSIPLPLQGTSYYFLGESRGFNQLYDRLLNRPTAERPALGKPTPLPFKPVKTNVSMFLASPIDIDLWNRAQWRGTFYVLYDDRIPCLGLGFRDERSGRKIFEQWLERYGANDDYEELRISIVEGPIRGEHAGYTVHIGPDYDNLIQRYRRYGFQPNNDIMLQVSRLNRMNPLPESQLLQQFKDEFRLHKAYSLIPGVLKGPNFEITPFHELGIRKRNVYFRHVDEISDNDLDLPVLGTGTVQRPQWRTD